jgi:hypothetical protein
MPSHTSTRASTPAANAFDEADRVVEKHFVVADLYTDRREASQVGKERRGERIARIVTVEIRPHQLGDLRSCEVRVGDRTRRPTFGQREVCDGRQRNAADNRAPRRGAARVQEGKETKS